MFCVDRHIRSRLIVSEAPYQHGLLVKKFGFLLGSVFQFVRKSHINEVVVFIL
jgi:hypothetical protein